MHFLPSLLKGEFEFFVEWKFKSSCKQEQTYHKHDSRWNELDTELSSIVSSSHFSLSVPQMLHAKSLIPAE
uniref:Aberrant root formation protein 4 isoform X1 n=1 Tax=Rhizophora mucronata TaxID=61149 RepID=A0A2P2LV44_RHIMU